MVGSPLGLAALLDFVGYGNANAYEGSATRDFP
jgi:hypothetical protein